MKNSFFKKILAFTALTTIGVFNVGIIAIPVTTSAQLFTQQQMQGVPQGTKISEDAPKTKVQTGCVSTKDEYCLLEPIVVNGTSQDRVNIASYLGEMFKIGIGLAGIFAVFMIVWGGFEYVSTDAIAGKSAGKEKIEGALWGLGLALGSYLILNTINPELLKFSAGPEPIDTAKLAQRIRYTDESLVSARKLDEIRQKINECNEQEKQLRIQGKTEEADALSLKCKIDTAINSVSAKTEKQDEKTQAIIIAAGRNNIIGYYDKKIKDLENQRDLAEKVIEDKPTVLRLEKAIDTLKIQKNVSLVNLQQEIDTKKAISIIASIKSKLTESGKEEAAREALAIKNNINARAVREFDKLKTDYPNEAEIIRLYVVKKDAEIIEAYNNRASLK